MMMREKTMTRDRNDEREKEREQNSGKGNTHTHTQTLTLPPSMPAWDHACASGHAVRAHRMANFSDEVRVVANLECTLELHKEKGVAVTKKRASELAVAGTSHSAANPFRWRERFKAVGIDDAREVVGKKLGVCVCVMTCVCVHVCVCVT